jgi:hypothetical protein
MVLCSICYRNQGYWEVKRVGSLRHLHAGGPLGADHDDEPEPAGQERPPAERTGLRGGRADGRRRRICSGGNSHEIFAVMIRELGARTGYLRAGWGRAGPDRYRRRSQLIYGCAQQSFRCRGKGIGSKQSAEPYSPAFSLRSTKVLARLRTLFCRRLSIWKT